MIGMYFKYLAGVLLGISASACYGQTAYDVKGSIKGLTNGTVKLAVYNEDDRTQTVVDSTSLSNGAFEFKGKIAPQMMYIIIEPGNFNFKVFVDGQDVITADSAGARYYDYTKYGLGKGAIVTRFTESGSKNYDDWMAYQNNPGQKQFDSSLAALNKKFTAAGSDIDAQYKVRDKMDSVRMLLYSWQKNIIDQYVAQNPSSVAGIYMFDQLYPSISSKMTYADLDIILSKFTGDASQSPYYDSLVASGKRLKAVQPGSTAPDFTLLKRDSSKFTLSSVTKGKYTMIDFWASWCHPCRQAIPHWKGIYQKYHTKGFDIVSVSDDNKWNSWIKAMDIEKMPWIQVDDAFARKNMPGEVCSLYMITGLPCYVLLDKEGKILVYTDDEAKIDARLKEIYNE
jgi:thiol-disulfide isomerase/thioredoxin